jgi:hypothetical protein
MAILGKDLFAFDADFLHFTALFSADGLLIDAQNYKYGELVTAFLNCDATDYLTLIPQLREAGAAQDLLRYESLTEQANKLICAMPLFCDRTEQQQLLKVDYFNPFLQNEPPGPFRMLDGYCQLAEDLTVVHERYTWFIKEIFYRQIPKQERNQFAWQIEENGMSAFVSGRSLGQSCEVDPAISPVQYEIRLSQSGEPCIYEKRNFTTLLDFLYTDLMKAFMYGHSPKPCKLCGRFFLQERGFSYEYCNGIAPEQQDKTCREVGALNSFRKKVQSNEIWKIHQRAYKKYYARVLKKRMSKAEFNLWAQEVEKARDEALEEEQHLARRGQTFDYETLAKRMNDR